MPKPVSFPFPIRNPLPINSAFGIRPLYGDFHSGVDFNSTTGAWLNTPVRAAGAGVVIESYDGNIPWKDKPWRPTEDRHNWEKLRGTMVNIDHGDGWRTRYHMLQPDSNIPVGTVVQAGDMVGRVGSSGSSTTGPHLHFELWKDGRAINPVGQLTYNPGAFASTGTSTPIDNEEDMSLTPLQAQQLDAVWNAIFKGGASMSDNGRSIEDSLAGIVTVVDQIKTEITKPVTRSIQSQPTILPADGSPVEITQFQDTADINSLLRIVASRPVTSVDTQPIIDAVVAAIEDELQEELKVSIDAEAIAKAVNDESARRQAE